MKNSSTMNRKLSVASICALVAGFFLLSVAPSVVAREQVVEKPRAILLGFDGVDFELARQWIESGDLPNLKKLAEQGSFRPLETANPAQSPVSWALVETASNPGKTNIGDFVRRIFRPSGDPMPRLAGVQVKSEGVPADQLGKYVSLSSTKRLLLSLGIRFNGLLALALLFGGLLLVISLTFKWVFRLGTLVSLLIGALLAGGATYGGQIYVSGLPAKYPVSESEMEGVRFWDALGEAGIRVKGIDVPAAFPCEAHPNASILGGLNTPDISGGIGSWYIYTNDEWSMSEESTSSGGTILKLYEDKDGVIKADLRGPEDFVSKYGYADQKDALNTRMEADDLSSDAREAVEKELKEVQTKERTWRQYERYKTAAMHVRPDFDQQVAQITIDGQSQSVAQGDYSDFFRVDFKLTSNTHIRGLVRVLVSECFLDAEGEQRLRLFVPSISISPEAAPPHLPISAPSDYVEELAKAIGPFDTVGWDGYTNPLKDLEISEQAFMQGVEHLFGWREKLLMHELSQDDWDVLFHVEYGTDRTAHMMYRYFDPGHPHFDAKDKDGNLIREQEIQAFGRTFKTSDCILETYREMDRILGQVIERIESGSLGSDVRLMLISDHGFQSYRYGVNLNVWLNRMGYLARTGEPEPIGAPSNIEQGRSSGNMFGFVDWSRTRAYSMGLGKIYINLKGREPKGIVERSEYDALKAEIIAKLKEFRDPVDGHENAQVVINAYDALEVNQGPKEANITDYGDIILGFNQWYRVSGSTSSGGYEKDAYATFGIADNDEPWSGDHCGVDLDLVRGVFFSNFKIQAGFTPGLMGVAPTLLEIFGVDLPPDWDGKPIPRVP